MVNSIESFASPKFALEEIPDANKNTSIPKIYLNGFIVAMSNSDVIILGKINNEPNVVLNLSFNTAKTLIKQLNMLLVGLEFHSGVDVLTLDTVDEALAKLKKQ